MKPMGKSPGQQAVEDMRELQAHMKAFGLTMLPPYNTCTSMFSYEKPDAHATVRRLIDGDRRNPRSRDYPRFYGWRTWEDTAGLIPPHYLGQAVRNFERDEVFYALMPFNKLIGWACEAWFCLRSAVKPWYYSRQLEAMYERGRRAGYEAAARHYSRPLFIVEGKALHGQ